MIDHMRVLAHQGVDLTLVLDIGSYHGQFGDMCALVWPHVNVISIEANPANKKINPRQITALLSNRHGEWLEFYTPRGQVVATGASYKLEQTSYYVDPIKTPMQSTTLDSLWHEHKWSGDWFNRGLIKLDTQGSELDILQGAENFLRAEKPRFILLEASHRPYNADAPSAGDAVAHLRSLGYQWIDIWHQLRLPSGMLLQTDLLFERQSP